MPQNTKTILTVLGFVFLIIGFLTLVLNFVGIDFTFMYWMKSFGPVISFLLKVGIIIAGFIMIFFGMVDLEREEV